MTLPATYTAYLPIVINNPQPFAGVQVDSPITIPVIPNRIYHVPARWMGLDAWFDANMQAVAGERVIIGTRTTPHPACGPRTPAARPFPSTTTTTLDGSVTWHTTITPGLWKSGTSLPCRVKSPTTCSSTSAHGWRMATTTTPAGVTVS